MSYNTNYTFKNSGVSVDIGTVFCDLTNNQTVSGKKQFSSDVSLNGNVTLNTVGTSLVVSGNVTVGNLNANNNLYINGSAVATQSYVLGLGYVNVSTASTTYASLSVTNTFGGTQTFTDISCSSTIGGGNRLRVTSGMTTLDGGINVTGGNIYMCATPKLSYTTIPNTVLTGMWGITSNTQSTDIRITEDVTVNITSVYIPSPGTYLFNIRPIVSMDGGGGGPFWYNYSLAYDAAGNSTMVWLNHYEYIAYGNGPSYPIHNSPYVVTFSQAKTIYLNAYVHGTNSAGFASSLLYTKGTLTAIRLC
jgi:hypothetical protein